MRKNKLVIQLRTTAEFFHFSEEDVLFSIFFF